MPEPPPLGDPVDSDPTPSQPLHVKFANSREISFKKKPKENKVPEGKISFFNSEKTPCDFSV